MKIHMVKKGESLYLIAQKYNVPLEDLIGANPEIANPDVIDVGMKVKIPAPAHPAYEMMHQHTVQQGDTLWKLSKAWGIPLADMIKANPQLKNPNVLLTGEVVNIPKLPAAGSGEPSHTMPGTLPGKKNTAVMPEAVVEVPPAPEAKEVEMAAPLPETPPVPLPTPVPMPLPEVEKKAPHPIHFKQEIHEHNLFAQFPVPAVEASAQAPAEPFPPKAAQQMPTMGGYGPTYAPYQPSEWSGDYGDVAPASMGPHAHMPTNVAPVASEVHGGYWPFPAAPFSPMVGGAHAGGDCGCGGGASYAQPAVGGMPHSYPGMSPNVMPSNVMPSNVMPSNVMPSNVMPSNVMPSNVMPSNVMPSNVMPSNVMPSNVMPSNVMPSNVMPSNVMPSNVMPSNVMPSNVMPSNVMPSNVMPSNVMPTAAHYGHHEAVSPAFAPSAGASAMPEFPGGMFGFPMFHPMTLPAMQEPCPPHAAYGMPYGDNRYGYGYGYGMAYPQVPTVPAQSQTNGESSQGDDADSLALHGAGEETEAVAATVSRKKQGGAGKSKRGPSARKAKPKRKESLPWIKW